MTEYEFEKKTLEYIKRHALINSGERILVTLSGGQDSVGLLCVLKRLKSELSITLGAVHIGHGIRGEEALRDERFAEEFCERHSIEIFSERYDVPAIARERGMSEEEAGRAVRYEAFERLALEWKADKVALAHHANDQAETVLFNLIRGSGLSGLCGMSPKRDIYIRPLLWAKKLQIGEYLKELGEAWVMDSSNLDDSYSRNRIRLNILPELEKVHPGATSGIVRAAGLLETVKAHLDLLVQQYINDNVTFEEPREGTYYCELDAVTLSECDNALREAVLKALIGKVAGSLKDISYTHVEAVEGLLRAKTGLKVDLPYGVTAYRSYERLIIKRERASVTYTLPEAVEINLNELPKKFSFSGYEFMLSVEEIKDSKEYINAARTQNMYTKFADCGKISDVVRLRLPEEGDYIVIDPDGHKKLLRRLFIDEKIAVVDRKSMPVLAEGNSVIWILSGRIGARYYVDQETKKILRIEIKKQ